MRNITILLLFTTLFGYAQIDYKGLVRNLEEVNVDTDIPTFLKDLPFEESYGDIKFSDERFLQFYGVVINKVKFSSGWDGKAMQLTPFDEIKDFDKIKSKLIELYGEPQKNDRGYAGSNTDSLTYFKWENDELNIVLKIELEDQADENVSPEFKSFDEFYIIFKKQ